MLLAFRLISAFEITFPSSSFSKVLRQPAAGMFSSARKLPEQKLPGSKSNNGPVR
jgi:hypothetical protein